MIDGYHARFARMRAAQAAYDRTHEGHAVSDPYDLMPTLRHEVAALPSVSDESLKEIRCSLVSAANTLIERFVRDGLLTKEQTARYRVWCAADHHRE